MKTKRLAAALAGGLFSVAALAGCGSDSGGGEVAGSWDEILEAANEEGSVLLYSSHNPVNLEALKKAFEAEYPDIKMEFVRGTDAELNPKVEVESQTGQGAADVHMVTDTAWINSAIESDAYSAELRGPEFESENYKSEESLKGGRFALMSVAAFALGWNTDKVPDGLEDVTDVLDPSLKGKIGIVNPAGIAVYVDMYRFLEKTYGADFLQQLADLEPRIYPSALGIAQALTSGEISAAPVVNPLVTEVKSGAPVDWKLSPHPWGAPWYTHVLSAAPHPNAAQVLANFMASKAGQTALSGGYASTLPDIDGAIATADEVTLADAADLSPEDVEKYTTTWEEMFVD
ncbi:transporter [Nocardioides aromaticivorans]|uniref:Transporter n=1 Tax=Nocardioides aromaticivorans TaxID=200618 RepID=A0ABX7PF35_9ACTN|nr:extracellular solute-binding protein [Nocardioides aromaticivorans]QSR24421.1 transporter [Nocardioides aromaticivorans]